MLAKTSRQDETWSITDNYCGTSLIRYKRTYIHISLDIKLNSVSN